MHKRNFSLTSGVCLNDDNYGIITFNVKVEGDDIYVLLPDAKDLDQVIATNLWMIKRDTAKRLDSDAQAKDSTVEIVGPKAQAGSGCGSVCVDSKLEW